MRVSISLFVFAGAAVACSSDPDPLRGHHAAAVKPAPSESPAPARPPAPPGKPSADDPTPTNAPAAPVADASTPPPPDAGPPMGTCANPTCTNGGAGSFRCRATDSDGADVQLDCESGDCACFTNGILTTEQPGDIADVGDARSFFFANCQCL